MVRGWLTKWAGAQSLLGLLLLTPLAAGKGGHGGGHGGHAAGHCGRAGGGHVSVPHAVGSGHARAYRDRLVTDDPRSVWHCGFNAVQVGATSAAVRRSCGAPETMRQVVFADEQGEHVIDVWSYQPLDSQVRILKFEAGSLISVEAVGPAR